eukprot:scaffold23361_cov68-Phaeocystis_antarctica.AAC.2
MSPAAGAAMRAVLAEMGDELQAEREAAQWYSGTRAGQSRWGHYRTCAVSVPASGVGTTHRQQLEVQLESVTPNTFFVADGVAADHPFSARIEAAHKIIGNHEKAPPSSASPVALSPALPCLH